MSVDGTRSIGERIADARKGRGLTQRALADRIHVSLSLLRKVEQGARDATPALVAATAKVLGVDVTALTGQPYDQDGRRPDRIHALVPRLRQAFTYWDLAPDSSTSRGWQDLRSEAERVADLRRTAQHIALAEALPDLLIETTAAVHVANGTDQRRMFEILTVLLFAAHSVTYKTGYEDLSTVVEDRLSWAAEHARNPIIGALAAWARTTSMLQAGSYDIGMRLLDRVQDDLTVTSRSSSAAMQISGPLHLRSAILSARGGDADSSYSHLREARTIAAHLGDIDQDGGWYQLSFGPSNVAIHEVAASVELGDGGAAVARARDLRLPGDLPPIRAAQHYVDLSRAQMWTGDRDSALHSLYSARKLAPQQTRHLPTTREVVRMLLRAHHRSNLPLTQLVGWLGTEV
jgi:transcriptional regulator with XRE-family HTH domain